jgi:hypothetical protein
MLFKRQKFDWVLVALFALGLFLYVSYQPRFRLRTEMPPDFIDEPLTDLQQSSSQAKIASAYWSCLASDIQWQYGYGHALPVDPPPGFTAIGASGLAADDTNARIRYWRKARRFWYLPTAWQKDYEWNFNWTTDWVQNVGDAMRRLFERLGSG